MRLHEHAQGTDPGKLKKVWFLGALLSRPSPLGMRPHDLLLFVDAFDVAAPGYTCAAGAPHHTATRARPRSLRPCEPS